MHEKTKEERLGNLKRDFSKSIPTLGAEVAGRGCLGVYLALAKCDIWQCFVWTYWIGADSPDWGHDCRPGMLSASRRL